MGVAVLAAAAVALWAPGVAAQAKSSGGGEGVKAKASATKAKAVGQQAKTKTKTKTKAKGIARSKNSIVLDRVVAVVNNEVILQSDIDLRMLPELANLEQISDRSERERRERQLRGQVLEQMVSEELIVQAAQEAKLKVEDKEVAAAIADIKKQNGLDDAGFEQALAMQGLTLQAYKKDVERQLLRHRSINMLVRPRVTVTEEDVKRRFDEKQRLSGGVSEIHLKHILVGLPAKPSDQQVAAAKAKAGEFIQQVKDGASFDELAKQHSDDEATKAGGGDLGWISRGSLPTEWESVVFSMNEGEVRGPINGPSGLHVFYVEAAKSADAKPFDEQKEQLRNELYRKELDKQTRMWLDELRKKAYIERKTT